VPRHLFLNDSTKRHLIGCATAAPTWDEVRRETDRPQITPETAPRFLEARSILDFTY
jgi:hypothetical protein